MGEFIVDPKTGERLFSAPGLAGKTGAIVARYDTMAALIAPMSTSDGDGRR